MLNLLLVLQIVSGTGLGALILNALLAIAIPAAATWLFAKITFLLKWFAAMQDWEKRALVGVYAAIAAAVAHYLGVTLPADFAQLSGTDVQAILTVLVAFIVHRVQKNAVA